MSHNLSSIAIALLLTALSTRTIYAQVVINEFVVDPNPEWVEFYNASDSAGYLLDYWLDDDTHFNDDAGSSPKKSLTSLNLSNPAYPYIELNSFLNNAGDLVVLFGPDGSMIDQHSYSSNPGEGVSIGRSPDQTGIFTILISTTKGQANSGPKPTPAPTPLPTPTNTPTPTPTPTPRPTNTPTTIPTVTRTPTASPTTILGIQETVEPPPDEIDAMTIGSSAESNGAESEGVGEKPRQSNKRSAYLTPIIISATGALLLLGSSVPFLTKMIKRLRDKHQDSKEVEV